MRTKPKGGRVVTSPRATVPPIVCDQTLGHGVRPDLAQGAREYEAQKHHMSLVRR